MRDHGKACGQRELFSLQLGLKQPATLGKQGASPLRLSPHISETKPEPAADSSHFQLWRAAVLFESPCIL